MNRQQAINLAYIDPDECRHMASLSHNDINIYTQKTVSKTKPNQKLTLFLFTGHTLIMIIMKYIVNIWSLPGLHFDDKV